MFIATWSISEVSIKVRDLIMRLISGFDSLLITYQDRFEEVNNLEYFSHLKETKGNFNWYHREIEHIPNNFYLLGSK